MSNDEPEGIPFKSTDLKSDPHLPIQKRLFELLQ